YLQIIIDRYQPIIMKIKKLKK
ncbi:uncharacterized protein METZ01_LOCUS107980, partial [marine metagenome]